MTGSKLYRVGAAAAVLGAPLVAAGLWAFEPRGEQAAAPAVGSSRVQTPPPEATQTVRVGGEDNPCACTLRIEPDG